MSEKLVSQLDNHGYFVASVIADESPLEPGVFLFPAGSVDIAPPTVALGQRARFDDGKFVFETIPEVVIAPAVEAANVTQPPNIAPSSVSVQVTAFNAPAELTTFTPAQQRARAYTLFADPIFFKAQRGEATMDEWTAKIAEIRAQFPDVADPDPVVPAQS